MVLVNRPEEGRQAIALDETVMLEGFLQLHCLLVASVEVIDVLLGLFVMAAVRCPRNRLQESAKVNLALDVLVVSLCLGASELILVLVREGLKHLAEVPASDVEEA